jgi:hypothetical protein
MGFKLNKVKVDLCSYPHYMFLAPRKFGKTTWWSKLVKKAWGDETKGLLVSFGNEEGYHSLDNLQVEVATDWSQDYDEETETRGFEQIVDDIVENNKTYGIKGICFDTFDTMVDVATKEVFRLHKKEKGTPCKSLNDAFGGYNRGKDRLILLINDQMARLRNAGIAVFILCHTKLKEKTDLFSGEKYEQITNNLQDNIYSAIADTAQMVMVGGIDREIVDGKILGEHRIIYLRGNSFIDAGSRFTVLPEKIDLSPEAFLEAFEYGVKNSITEPVSESELNNMKKAEEKQHEKQAEIAIKKEHEVDDETANIDLRQNYLAIISDKFIKASDSVKASAKAKLAESNCKKFTDEKLPVDVLCEIVALLEQ